MLGTTPKARFGSFQFDFASQVLSKNGSTIPLSASQTRLLTLFLTSRGVLLTRDEIASHLWKDSRNIDVSNGINSAVNRLRYTLNDDTARPAYIETVIGLGYRFIAPVEQLYPDDAESSSKAKASVPEEDWGFDARRAGDRPAALDAPRSETKPRGQPESFVLAESAGRQKPGRRFRNAAVFATPAIIAAILASALVYRSSRKAGEGSSGPPPTGTFYPVTFNDSDDKVTAEAISPGGDKVAYADRSGVSIAWIDSRATQLLASPTAFRGRRIDWYPDGQHLALSGMTENTHRQQVWQLSPDGSQPTLIADDADLAAVSPDGRSIAMTVHGDTEIDIAPVAGGAPRRLLKAGEKERFVFLLWARSGRYLIAERFNEGRLPDSRSTTPSGDIDSLKRWHYEAVDCNSGRLLASQENIRFDSGYILADGRLVYPEALSIWPTQTNLNMLRTDPVDGRVLSPAVILQTTYGDQPNALTASTNGQRIALILNRTTSDVFAGALHFPGPVLDGAIQLTHRSYESYPHAWSANDDRILLENNNVGLAAIFEQRLDRATPDLVARLPIDAAMAEFSPDGQWILFLGLDPVPRGQPRSIFRVPVAGGIPQQLHIPGEIEEFHCSASKAGRCVLREAIEGKEFVYYALDPVKGMGEELARTPWVPSVLGDWSVSPDGSTAAIASHNNLVPAIHLLSLLHPGGKFDDIPVDGLGVPLDANWAANGQGLFVETKTESGYSLLYIDLKGHARVLRESGAAIWGVPSHDGRRLAFPDVTMRTSVHTEKVGYN
jgi:DNA-binding winged helix-turn-helix (wHTH) protein